MVNFFWSGNMHTHSAAISALILTAAFSSTAHADTEACKVVLCLASGAMPNECVPPVQAYLARFAEHPEDANNYLASCDMGSSPNIPNVRTISQAYGHCTASSVNAATQFQVAVNGGDYFEIRHKAVLPQYCSDYSAMIGSYGGAMPALPHFAPPPPVKKRDPRCGSNAGCPFVLVKQPLELGHWED